MKSAINARLLSAAELTRQDATFADIGTDHAYLPLFLLDAGRIKHAFCCDINEGPLASARRNAEDRGRLRDCEFVLTDGASVLAGRGITDYAICGMGGELIADIIARAPHLCDPSLNLILQPLSRQEKLREYLYSAGFEIKRESYSFDAGKYYVCMQVSYVGKAREISPVESVAGPSSAEFCGSECRLAYLGNKLTSLERAYRGKSEVGEATESEAELISQLREYIKKYNSERKEI